MNREASIKGQREAGTIRRNNSIRHKIRDGATLASIGRKEGLTRERIRQIKNQPGESPNPFCLFIKELLGK